MFVSSKLFQPRLMFVSGTGAYLSEAPFQGLTHKHQSRLGRLGRDKLSSLLRTLKITLANSFIMFGLGPNVIKHLMSVI